MTNFLKLNYFGKKIIVTVIYLKMTKKITIIVISIKIKHRIFFLKHEYVFLVY